MTKGLKFFFGTMVADFSDVQVYGFTGLEFRGLELRLSLQRAMGQAAGKARSLPKQRSHFQAHSTQRPRGLSKSVP